ncbi:MAG: M56 family metallopeptidase [Lachnospiraceae bacterium]|nr:M56 family metallopeptidase [Lachnospiraceae bacterium]
MGITVYSVVISVVFFNVALIAAFLMRRSNAFLASHTVSFLLLMVLLGIVRLLTPIDFDKAFVVRSYQVIPAIEDFIHRPIAGSFTFGSLMLLIWLAGTVVFLIRDILKQIHFVRTSRNYPPSDRRDLIDFAGEYGSNFGLLVSSSISRPYTAGLFRPAIYLPDIELPEESWRIILRHEVQHIRSHDEAKKLFFLAVQALFWWNPLAHISRKEIDTILELQCDAKLSAGMTNEEVDAYLALLKSLKDRNADRRIPVGASTLVLDQKELDARFAALQCAGSSSKKRPPVVLYILLMTAFVMSYFVIIQPVRFPEKADYKLDTALPEDVQIEYSLVSPEDLYIVYKDGHYYLYSNGVQLNEVFADNMKSEPFASLPIIGG